MHKLVVLSDHPRWNDYYSIIFPLYKWKNFFKNYGINLSITTDKYNKHLKNADTAIIISRVFADGWQNIQKRNSHNEEALITYLTDLKKTVNKLCWYDRSDSSGSTDFPIINYVDIFLKNQVLKDLTYYSIDNGAKSVRQWLTDDTNLLEPFKKYDPCPIDQLDKIKLGWNITHSDHRVFGFKYQRMISNYIFNPPKIYAPSTDRHLDFSLRGNFDYGNKNAISTQRFEMFKILKEISSNNTIISDKRITKSAFMQELSESKICTSPFGWGEICYRDFEIFIAGALMIKPSLDNIKTFPDLFIENETYIPVNWNLSDLKEKIEKIIKSYSDYVQIAHNGQQAFLNAISDGDAFVNHIKNIID